MKFAITSDEAFPIHELIIKILMDRGHQVLRLGAVKSGCEESYVLVAKEAALRVLRKDCDEAILFCYTGTGVAIAANKIGGIRAALCTDAETARNARIWNHANVLVLSNRLLSHVLAQEILSAWLGTAYGEEGRDEVRRLSALDEEFRSVHQPA